MADANDPMTGASGDDSEWIKSLVAEALLRASDDDPAETAEAAAEPAVVPTTPTPTNPTSSVGAPQTQPAARPAPAPTAPSAVAPTAPAMQPPATPPTVQRPATPAAPAVSAPTTPVSASSVQTPAHAAPTPSVQTPAPAAPTPSVQTPAHAAPTPPSMPQVSAPTAPLVVGRRGTEPSVPDPAGEPFRTPAPGDSGAAAPVVGVPSGATSTSTITSPRPLASAGTQNPSLSTLLADADPLGPQDGVDPVMVEADATTEGFRSSDIRTVLEWLAVIVSALAVALLIKAFVLQAFWIPSESMETTVNKGDRILVNKVSYRLHEVRRGDLVVFKKLPGTPGDTEDLIKRAIALPGETIEVRADGRIYIWGAGETSADALLLEEPYLDPQNEFLAGPSASDALSVDIWDERCVNQPRTPGRCTLGEDQLFMMGDNRNSSSDSRFFGPITEDLIVGRAFLRIWPLGEISSL